MITYFKSENNQICSIPALEPGCWVNMIHPDEEEIASVSQALELDPAFLRAALDEEETSRIEVEDDVTLLIVDIPYSEEQKDGGMLFSTLPLAILVTKQNVVTVSLEETSVVRDFAGGLVKNVNTAMKTRFTLNLMLRAAGKYLFHLRQIEKISSKIEGELYKSLKNKELIQLLTLEKSLVYFTTSLKSTETTLEKLLRGRILKLYEEDQDLLEDVIIEFKQAIEMADIYSNILSGTMDAFASVISNNLNIIMKVLTVITILMTIPNIVFSFYGMNVQDMPLPHTWFPVTLSIAITGLTWLVLKKKNLY
ncbi:magnesium transporter CorA family protein [Intestinimonas sp. MSJ-38]|uniref:magnesium transporter CorA family protein n=1 Tax=Intestinimonas sp. MSJ-38 TaxID=2841532 RepID=UPI000E4CD443|nr:magnesium transporter CorA family protein [Intestinimonas sp. MSJ-38]MBU5431941.1 magnesium transporter CorA family protein [Intestinimonas sp. MSJ-38]RHT72496.1 magnesium transporter CorA family protein [Ruminococcaceae bacterium AM28-23LB]